MEKKKDVEKATRVAMRQLMGIDEITMMYMTQKGAEKVAGGEDVNGDKLKKIYGNNRGMVCVHSFQLLKCSAA